MSLVLIRLLTVPPLPTYANRIACSDPVSFAPGHFRSAIGQFPPENGLVDAAKADHTRQPFVLPHHGDAAETV